VLGIAKRKHRKSYLRIYKHRETRYHPKILMKSLNVATPFLKECEDDTHTLEMGTWESSEILETLEFDCRGQKHLALRCSSCRWKALNESYKFASDLIPIQGLSKEL
jgi:hypothetical protein